MKKLNLIQVNTTAWEEEDFLLVTTLNEKQIEAVVSPLVISERNDGDVYDNDALVDALKKQFPSEIILHYTPDAIDLLSI